MRWNSTNGFMIDVYDPSNVEGICSLDRFWALSQGLHDC